MLTCREAADRLADGTGDASSLAAAFRLRFHLLFCRHCRRYARQIRLLGAAIRQSACPESERDEIERLESRILDAVDRHCERHCQRR